jgi:NAD(P)-dependent dehydrogenase (short-subunit alcohol dehydrogenase family)
MGAWVRAEGHSVLVVPRPDSSSPGSKAGRFTRATLLELGALLFLAVGYSAIRAAQGTDVAAAVAYLISDDAGYVSGQTLNVDGGLYMH